MLTETKVEAGGRSVDGRIIEEGGDVFRMILIVFRVEAWGAGRCVGSGGDGQEE